MNPDEHGEEGLFVMVVHLDFGDVRSLTRHVVNDRVHQADVVGPNRRDDDGNVSVVIGHWSVVSCTNARGWLWSDSTLFRKLRQPAAVSTDSIGQSQGSIERVARRYGARFLPVRGGCARVGSCETEFGAP